MHFDNFDVESVKLNLAGNVYQLSDLDFDKDGEKLLIL